MLLSYENQLDINPRFESNKINYKTSNEHTSKIHKGTAYIKDSWWKGREAATQKVKEMSKHPFSLQQMERANPAKQNDVEREEQ